MKLNFFIVFKFLDNSGRIDSRKAIEPRDMRGFQVPESKRGQRTRKRHGERYGDTDIGLVFTAGF